MGSPGRGGHGQGKSGSAGYFGDLKKGGKRMLNTAIEKISEGVAYIWEGPPGVCPQCRGRVPPELEGDFCSMKCYDQYWRDYRNHRICATGDSASHQIIMHSLGITFVFVFRKEGSTMQVPWM